MTCQYTNFYSNININITNIFTFSTTVADREKITFSATCLADKVEETFGAVAEVITSPVGEQKYYLFTENREVR